MMDNNTVPLQIKRVSLIDFRCFEKITIDFKAHVTLICGNNGVGKTSILEALHYACYLKSFRTYLLRDIAALHKKAFYIKLLIGGNELDHVITIGCSIDNKRLVKVDGKGIVSYKDLLAYCRIISVIEGDLALVQGSPDRRRLFLDQALFLYDLSYVSVMTEFKTILNNRNALLQKMPLDQTLYVIISQQLLQYTHIIQKQRVWFLRELEDIVHTLVRTYFNDEFTVRFAYREKQKNDAYGKEIQQEEIRYRRSLFGAHLDDFDIEFAGKKARTYASRGQQKVILFLIKIAHITFLSRLKGPAVFLIDDFLTDFDPTTADIFLTILQNTECQLIFTSPSHESMLTSLLCKQNMPYEIIAI